jgi:hypothetical protein
MKLTRRELAAALAGAAAANAQAPAQSAPEDLLKNAVEETRRDSAAIANYAVPMATEPAFSFRP